MTYNQNGSVPFVKHNMGGAEACEAISGIVDVFNRGVDGPLAAKHADPLIQMFNLLSHEARCEPTLHPRAKGII